MWKNAIQHRLQVKCVLLPKNRSSRFFYSSNVKIPPPTWSIASLELDKAHPPVSIEELETLANRALLDVRHLPVDQLRQDLGNMIHMIQKVVNYQESQQTQNRISPEDMYDFPRGVKEAPLRTEEENREEYEQDSKNVWDSFLKRKTSQVGSHSYFAIVTKREKLKGK